MIPRLKGERNRDRERVRERERERERLRQKGMGEEKSERKGWMACKEGK